jgi:hypothetical protein
MNAELCVIVISTIIKRTSPMTRQARACWKIDVDQECSLSILTREHQVVSAGITLASLQ